MGGEIEISGPYISGIAVFNPLNKPNLTQNTPNQIKYKVLHWLKYIFFSKNLLDSADRLI